MTSLWSIALLVACVDPLEVAELPPAATDADRDGWAVTEDCDDANPARHPGQIERCNGVDDDCDGLSDNHAVDEVRWFVDADADGHGDPAQGERACVPIDGRITLGDDCDDRVATVFPGAEERCNGVDDDCDTLVDDGRPPTAWFEDADRDAWGAGDATVACDGPTGWVDRDGDCAPADPDIHPDALERCDGVDQDCDTRIDDDAADATSWFDDADGDGHGDPASREALCVSPNDGRIAVGDDCDDARPDVYPGRAEVCDGVDQDCDEERDDDPIDGDPWYADEDGDGWGDAASFALACAPIADASLWPGDCDDTDAAVSPDAAEIDDDGIDQDCDGTDPSGVDWAGIAGPCTDAAAAVGDPVTSQADVYRAGTTDKVGCSKALTGELGLGPDGTDPATSSAWTWTAGACTSDADHGDFGDDSLDRWSASAALTATGDTAVAWRFRYGLTWVYADLGEACGEPGTTDGASDWPVLAVIDDDLDNDGYALDVDCDDADADVNPGAPEDPSNGVDDDCDDEVDEYITIDEVSVGDLVITEIMFDPDAASDDTGEWIELANLGPDAIDLDGLGLESLSGSSTETETVSSPGLYVLAGERIVLGRTTDTATNGDAPVAYGWGAKSSDLTLRNTTGDRIAITNATDTIDEVSYDLSSGSAWPTKSSGKSFALEEVSLDATSNDDGASWCRSTSSFGDGDLGTPGEENDC